MQLQIYMAASAMCMLLQIHGEATCTTEVCRSNHQKELHGISTLQKEGQLKKILGTSIKEVGKEAAQNSLAQIAVKNTQMAVKSQSSYQVQTGAMATPTNQVTMNSTSNGVAMVVSSSEVDRTRWPSLCSIVTPVCKKLTGKSLSNETCAYKKGLIQGLCNPVFGPEDPLFDICAVTLTAGWTKICTSAVESGIPLTIGACTKLAQCNGSRRRSRRRRFWSATNGKATDGKLSVAELPVAINEFNSLSKNEQNAEHQQKNEDLDVLKNMEKEDGGEDNPRSGTGSELKASHGL